MFLDNYNTNDLVAEQIKNYLSGTHCTYLQLKSFILNKRPIPEVHSNIVAFLSQAKSQDQSQIQKILENQAYKNQITEDEQQIINARIEQLKDEELRARFNRELSAIPTQISTYEAEQRSIEDKINWAIYKPNINIIASQYLGPIAQLPSRVLNQQNWIAQQLRDNSQYYQIKIQVLLEKKKIIQKKLIEIDQRADLRQQSNTEREDRAKERLSYEKTGEHIEGTLSSKNLRKLLKSVQKQHTSLQKKCDQLIEESKLIHFAFFIEQLPLHLPSMKLSPQEVDALLSVSKFVRLHLQHDYEKTINQLAIK